MAVSCDPNDLLESSKCLTCIPKGRQMDVVIYLLATIAGVSTDPNTLLELSKNLQTIPDGLKDDVLLYVTCQAATAAGA